MMDLLLTALQGYLVPQVIAGIIGGVFGSIISAKQKIELYGYTVCFFLGLISTIWAAGIAEYFFYVKGLTFIFAHMGLGALVGIIGVSAVDVINLAAPDKMKVIVDKTSDGFIDRIFFWADKKTSTKLDDNEE